MPESTVTKNFYCFRENNVFKCVVIKCRNADSRNCSADGYIGKRRTIGKCSVIDLRYTDGNCNFRNTAAIFKCFNSDGSYRCRDSDCCKHSAVTESAVSDCQQILTQRCLSHFIIFGKGVVSYADRCRRYADSAESTIVKCVVSYGFNAVTDHDIFKLFAVIEGIISDRLCRSTDSCRHHRSAVIKRIRTDIFCRVGHNRLNERDAVIESAFTQRLYAFGNSNILKSCAIVESVISDGINSSRDSSIYKSGTACEGVFPYIQNVCRNGNAVKCCTVGKTVITDFVYHNTVEIGRDGKLSARCGTSDDFRTAIVIYDIIVGFITGCK